MVQSILFLFIFLFFNKKADGTGKTDFKNIENKSMKQNTLILSLSNCFILHHFIYFNAGAF